MSDTADLLQESGFTLADAALGMSTLTGLGTHASMAAIAYA
jgi:hypothetical protein